jgi:hypothetical protein
VPPSPTLFISCSPTELGGKLVELRSLDDVRRGSVVDMPSPLRPRSVN